MFSKMAPPATCMFIKFFVSPRNYKLISLGRYYQNTIDIRDRAKFAKTEEDAYTLYVRVVTLYTALQKSKTPLKQAGNCDFCSCNKFIHLLLFYFSFNRSRSEKQMLESGNGYIINVCKIVS